MDTPKFFTLLRKIEHDHSTEISKNLVNQSAQMYRRNRCVCNKDSIKTDWSAIKKVYWISLLFLF